MPASRRRRWDRAIRKLAWFHRWLGVATCLIFALWFASGAVLVFQPFPSLPRADQLRLEAPIDLASVRVGPQEAIRVVGEPVAALRLVQRGFGPAYIASTQAGTVVIDATSGARLLLLSAAEAQSVSSRLAPTGTIAGPAFDYDQWVVHNRFDPLRPFFRIDMADGTGTRYYLSARTGEIVQRTDATARAWNWVGAVLHWAYVTPLRSSFTAWDRSVWWLSFVGLLVAVAGTILGIVRTVAAQRQRRPSLTFYRPRWMRWHHLLGLFASVFVLTWMLSGWLSMDHGRLFSRGTPTDLQAQTYKGLRLEDAFASLDPHRFWGKHDIREIEFRAVAGTPLMVAAMPDRPALRLDGAGAMVSSAALGALSNRGLAAAWPGTVPFRPHRPSATDIYTLAEGWPATAVLFADPTGKRPDLVIDEASGQLLTVLDGSRKAYAWIYYGLHTFNFPGLADHQVLRQILVIVPLAFGFVFSLTGVVLGYQRLRKAGRSAGAKA